MKILLAFLLVLNLLYAAWEYAVPSRTNQWIKPLADNLQTLQLLQERIEVEDSQVKAIETAQEKSRDSLPQVESPLMENPAKSNIACFTLGPFKDKNILQQLRDSIAEQVKGLKIRKRQELEKHRYWVYVTAQSSRAKAKAMAHKLRDKKIKDFYIVLKGDAKNSISLGHFRDPGHANRRMKAVAVKGFDVEVEVIYRNYDLYWLDYQLEQKNSSVEAFSGFSIEEYITDGVSQLDRACESAADS